MGQWETEAERSEAEVPVSQDQHGKARPAVAEDLEGPRPPLALRVIT